MEVFQDLRIKPANGIPLSDVEALIVRSVQWPRDLIIEKELLSAGIVCYSFSYLKDSKLFAKLYLNRNENELYVSNITPTTVSELTKWEYNEILNEFYRKFVYPLIQDQKITAELTAPMRVFADTVTDVVRDHFIRFAASANKSTGISHPLDRQRWFVFVTAFHKEKGKLNAELLFDALEDFGWSDDVASDLIISAEYSLELLKFYDSRNQD